MSRTLTAADRRALIRLASTMPAGSEERRAILAGLSSSVRAASRFVHAGVTFVESKSPLDYHGVSPRRIALCDSSVTEPSEDAHFKDLDPCVVAFLDFSPYGGDSIFIHYMNTRREHQRKGYARKLVNEFYRRHADKVTEPLGMMNWGKLMADGAEKLYREMAKKHPDVYHKAKFW